MTNGPLRLRTKGRPTTDPRAKTSGAKRVSLEGNPVEIRATAVTAAYCLLCLAMAMATLFIAPYENIPRSDEYRILGRNKVKVGNVDLGTELRRLVGFEANFV